MCAAPDDVMINENAILLAYNNNNNNYSYYYYNYYYGNGCWGEKG